MTSVQFEWGDNFRVKPNELLYLLIEGTKIEDSYLTFMRNCILGGDNFRAFRVDLGGQNSKGDNFQLYPTRCICGFMSSSYKKSWMASNNSQTHPDESQLKMCHLCTFKTLKDKALFYHIEVKHEKKTRFNCPRCDRQFYFEHQMKRHIKSTF